MTTVWHNDGGKWCKLDDAKKPKTGDKKCMCGCGSPCRASFAPGHDAKYKSYLKKKNIPIVGKVAEMAKKHGPIR